MELNLTMPKKKVRDEKLRAYKRHWAAIGRVQDELNSQWIHRDLSDRDVAEGSQLSIQTVKRFRQWGRGSGKASYSYFHGPNATTIFGIADELGMEFKLVPKRRRK